MRLFPPRTRPLPGSLLLALVGLAGLCAAGPHPATAAPETPPTESGPVPLIEIDLTTPDAWDRLISVDVDPVSVRPGRKALVLGWPGTLEALVDAGLCAEVVDADYGATLARRNGFAPGVAGAVVSAPEAVPPVGEGSLGGFWTYAEVAAILDSLAAADPDNILTEVDTIGTSRQGRPILALGVAGPGKPLGTRPEVLITALTHAREPGGMHSALHFLGALIDGYGVDPVMTYLVDEREIWFVPVVNPDGYAINEATWLSGGGFGLWRKNARDNDGNGLINNQDGVDLNRNFGYAWGYDNVGSSPIRSSATYRGPSAFSEPETAALRDFCLAHAFRTANNLHTFHEATLYPWGYISANTPDSTDFLRVADAMTGENRYTYGHSGQILYPVNGEANDWMYGDPSKPSTLAYTTEIGDQNDGFWPPVSRIVPLAELTLPAHVSLAYAAGVWVAAESLRVESADGVLEPGTLREVSFRLRHRGLSGSTSGGITVTATSGHAAVFVERAEAHFADLSVGQSAEPLPGSSLLLRVDPGATPGDPVPLYLEIADGAGYAGRDTLVVRLGAPTVVFADGGNAGMGSWTAAGGWGLETVDGDTVFSDSPVGVYADDADATLTLAGFLDLSGAARAVLCFRAQWDIEIGFDFATVEVSADSGASWSALPGRWTRAGHGTTGGYDGGTQTLGEPGYDATRRLWTDEEIDLSDYAGMDALRIRFRLRSDVWLGMDGWLIDDVSVLAYAPAGPLAAGGEPPERPALRPPLRAFPNPFAASSRIRFALDRASTYRLAVYDVAGREVRVLSQGYAEAGERELAWDGLAADGRRAPRGGYFVRLDTPEGSVSGRLLLLR